MTHTKRLLLESEEHGIYELDVLEVVVDHIVEFHSLICHVRASDTRKKRREGRETYTSPHFHVTHPI